ncbi:MAG: hypothetical protein EZS28_040405 [Streblomastix strix]|uniref:Uncharacterized protein n=1 Tax=Streblomastix strix TaxID=222440 RepID=A0A5J4U0J4_9EUKA|nr:MAG: hypothetical protein EZS28_040405 [Streblomastix strix]
MPNPTVMTIKKAISVINPPNLKKSFEVKYTLCYSSSTLAVHILGNDAIESSIGAEIQVTCYSSAGVIAIKDSLTKGVESYDSESIDGPKVDVHVKSAPIYSLETVVIDKQKGLTDLNNSVLVINVIRTTIEGQGGTLDVKMEPIVVSGETIDEQKNVNEDEEKTDDEEDTDEDSDEENEDDQKD